MLRDHFIGLGGIDAVALVIAAIGVLIPLTYTIFVSFLTRRHWFPGGEERRETAEYLRELQLHHAAEQIKRRHRSVSISGDD